MLDDLRMKISLGGWVRQNAAETATGGETSRDLCALAPGGTLDWNQIVQRECTVARLNDLPERCGCRPVIGIVETVERGRMNACYAGELLSGLLRFAEMFCKGSR